jgi:hypothetical protein
VSTTTFEVYDVYSADEVFSAYSPEAFLEELERHALAKFEEYVDNYDPSSMEDLMYSVLQDVYIKLSFCDDRTMARVFAGELKEGALNDRLDAYLDSKAEDLFGEEEDDDDDRRTALAHLRGEVLVLQMANERLENEIEALKKIVKPKAKRKSK